MSRDLTAGMIAEVKADSLAPIFLVKAEFDSGDLCLWTGYGNLSYGGDTYTGAGTLLSISQIEETAGIEANGISVSLNGELQSLIAVALAENYQNRPLTIYFGALNLTTKALISDPYKLFAGRMDVMEINNNANITTIGVNVESNLSILKNSRNRKYTPEDQKIDYATDTFFDTVASLQDAQVVWGKG